MRREPLQARSPRLTPEERKRARGKRSLFLTGEASRASHWTRKLERARILRGIHDTYGIHQRFMRNTCRIRISGASGGMYRCHHRRSATSQTSSGRREPHASNGPARRLPCEGRDFPSVHDFVQRAPGMAAKVAAIRALAPLPLGLFVVERNGTVRRYSGRPGCFR